MGNGGESEGKGGMRREREGGREGTGEGRKMEEGREGEGRGRHTNPILLPAPLKSGIITSY